MPDHEELEIRLDENMERNLAEFPDDAGWAALKAEIAAQHAPDPYEVNDGDGR